jgi:hypothetical protein
VVNVGADSGIDAPVCVGSVDVGVTPADDLHEVGGSRAWESGRALESSSGSWE